MGCDVTVLKLNDYKRKTWHKKLKYHSVNLLCNWTHITDNPPLGNPKVETQFYADDTDVIFADGTKISLKLNHYRQCATFLTDYVLSYIEKYKSTKHQSKAWMKWIQTLHFFF